MVQNDYDFSIALCGEDGDELHRAPITVNWESAMEWAYFFGIRSGCLSPRLPPLSSRIVPEWDAGRGKPYLAGLNVLFAKQDGEVWQCPIPGAYFQALAEDLTPQLRQKGFLDGQESFALRFLACARAERRPLQGSAPARGVRRTRPPLEVISSPLSAFKRNSRSIGNLEGEEEIPVFLPPSVLKLAAALTLKAGKKETGGILLGHLRWDPLLPELFLQVTGLIPARHTRSEEMKLTFTPKTWAEARQALAARGKGEIMAGWFHSHPFLREACRNCEKGKDGTCKADSAFLSLEDRELHRVCFPAPYSIALVIAQAPSPGLTHALFGWRNGLIRSRGYYLLKGVKKTKKPKPVQEGGKSNDQ